MGEERLLPRTGASGALPPMSAEKVAPPMPLSSSPRGFNCVGGATFSAFGSPGLSRPVPSLYRLGLADQLPYTPRFDPLFCADRVESRALALDLAGCLDAPFAMIATSLLLLIFVAAISVGLTLLVGAVLLR